MASCQRGSWLGLGGWICNAVWPYRWTWARRSRWPWSPITRAQHESDALVTRIGVEAAGHYHHTLVARLRAAGLEVVELNPRAVKDARGQQLLRTLKNDARDCGAMAELLIRGSGRPPQCRDEALAAQAAWVADRHRKVAAQVVLGNQIHGQLDLIFPGLTGCFAHA
jgi:transposase